MEVTGETETAMDPESDAAADMVRGFLEGEGIPTFLDIVPLEYDISGHF